MQYGEYEKLWETIQKLGCEIKFAFLSIVQKITSTQSLKCKKLTQFIYLEQSQYFYVHW